MKRPNEFLDTVDEQGLCRALGSGLVDEIHLFLNPIIIGGGNAALPDDLRVPLELLDERRFGNGVAHLRYRTAG